MPAPLRLIKLLLVLAAVAVLVPARAAPAVTLVATQAGVVDTSHWQVETAGGPEAHLVRVVTVLDALAAAVDADVLLADGSPLVLTWRRDAGDADVIDLSLALAIDSGPRHLELRLRSVAGAAPVFSQYGDISTSGVVQAAAPTRVVVALDEPVGALTDLLLGAPDGTVARSNVVPWKIDMTGLATGDRFGLVLRAGPPGDVDDDDDVDGDDHAAFLACLEADELDDTCELFFDFDASRAVDLRDFAAVQAVFTVPTSPDPVEQQ